MAKAKSRKLSVQKPRMQSRTAEPAPTKTNPIISGDGGASGEGEAGRRGSKEARSMDILRELVHDYKAGLVQTDPKVRSLIEEADALLHGKDTGQ